MTRKVLLIAMVLFYVISCKKKDNYYEFKVNGFEFTQYYKLNNNNIISILYDKDSVLVDSMNIEIRRSEFDSIRLIIDSFKTEFCDKDYDITIRTNISDSFRVIQDKDYRECRTFLLDLDCKYNISNSILKRLQYKSKLYMKESKYDSAYYYADVAVYRSSVTYFGGYTDDYLMLVPQLEDNYKKKKQINAIVELLRLSDAHKDICAH